jgi:hypothetical protein
MMPDFALETTFDFKFTTRQFSDGVPTTLSGSPVVDIYEDNDIAQITGAETLTVDFDGVTGLNNLRIAATAANGFGAGQSYSAVITTGTVGGTDVAGEVIMNFTVEHQSALRPTTAGRELDVTTTGEAGIDLDNTNGTLDAAQIGADAITAAKVANGTIDAATFAAGAIDATAIATGAIDADALAADAGTEIANAVWALDATGQQTQGTFGQAIGDPGADTSTIWDLANTNLDAAISTRSSHGDPDPSNFIDVAISSRLAPTTAARTLDVAATGEAGVDLGNVTGVLGQANVGWVDANSRVDVGQWLSNAVTVSAGNPDVNIESIDAGIITATEAPNLDAAITTRATPADVNAQVLDVMDTDTLTEPSQGKPTATPTAFTVLRYAWASFRNKETQTASLYTVFNDAGTALCDAAVSDDATTVTKAEMETGA